MTQQSTSTPTPGATPPVTPSSPQHKKATPFTRGEKVWYSLIAIFIVAALVWVISGTIKDSSHDNDLKDNGVRVTGTATGEAHLFNDRSRRGGITERYKVIYEYTYNDKTRNGRETIGDAVGEKVYDTKAEVEALKGKTADVYYDPDDAGKGTFVTNEP